MAVAVPPSLTNAVAPPALSQYSPEYRVLLRCALISLNPRSEEAKQLISEAVDWRSLILLAFEHGMAATLSWQLKVREWEGVPAPVQHDLQAYLSDNAHFSFRQSSEIAGVLEQFDAEGIAALLRN